MKLNLVTAKSAMWHLAHGGASGNYSNLGISDSDLDLTTGSTPWQGKDRNVVKRTLEALAFGALDTIGLDHFELSAEYVSGVISMFVHPANTMVASHWMQRERNSENLANPNGMSSVEPCTASQLFALTIMLQSDGYTAQCQEQFYNRTKVKIEKSKLNPIGGNNEKGKK